MRDDTKLYVGTLGGRRREFGLDILLRIIQYVVCTRVALRRYNIAMMLKFQLLFAKRPSTYAYQRYGCDYPECR